MQVATVHSLAITGDAYQNVSVVFWKCISFITLLMKRY
jgi:hypothetical protein